MKMFIKTMLFITALFVFSGCSDEFDENPYQSVSDEEAYLPLVGPQGTDNGVVLTCTGPLAGTPAVLCVDTANPTAGAGTASNPYKTITSAITAGKAGDTIQIAQGTYTGNPAIGTFGSGNSKRMNFHGGFQTGTSFAIRNAQTYRTILDGGLLNPSLRLFVNAGSNNMTVDGMSFTNGKGLGTNYTNGYGHGGGLYAEWYGSGTLTVSHCDFYANQTRSIAANSQMGGGLWVTTTWGNPGFVRLEDNYVYNNKAGKGAGIGATGRVTILRNRVESNLGQNDHGGGIYLTPFNAVIEATLVKNNTIGVLAGYGWGGGAVIAGGTATTKGNVFTGNFAPLIGSGLFWDEGVVGSMTNDLFFKNTCPNDARSGAAVYVDGAGSSGPGSTVTMTNVTVADHNCPNQGTTGATVFLERQSVVTMKNSIFWGNYKNVLGDSGTTYTATYSIIDLAGTGNLSTNPLFVDATNNDYHEKSTAGHYYLGGWVTDAVTSPAIDAGDTASSYVNEPAPNGTRVNMGAFGNTEEASKSATLDYEDCPGQPYTVTLDSTQVITGNAGTSDDDQAACGMTSGDRVYRLNLAATGGILSLNVTGATFALRSTCGSDVGESCGTSTTFEAMSSTYYVVVEGSGAFSLTVDYDTSVCGDGFLASTEECEPPTAYCVEAGQPQECTSTAPDPAADVCPGKSFVVSAGLTTLSSESQEFTTVNYTDDYDASCGSEPDGRDYVLNLMPAVTGTLTVSVGLTDVYCEDNSADEFCWDVVLSARTICTDNMTETTCVNDNFAGEEMVLAVTENVPVSIFVDGFNAGWYSYGPFDVQLELTP